MHAHILKARHSQSKANYKDENELMIKVVLSILAILRHFVSASEKYSFTKKIAVSMFSYHIYLFRLQKSHKFSFSHHDHFCFKHHRSRTHDAA
jgi:hypothetical protein